MKKISKNIYIGKELFNNYIITNITDKTIELYNKRYEKYDKINIDLLYKITIKEINNYIKNML